jgi:hypothetical protein
MSAVLNPFRKRTVGRFHTDGRDYGAWMELEPEAEPRRERKPGRVLIWVAALLLLGLAAAQGYVSFRAQFAYIDAAKHARVPSILEALGLDTGAVIFALLGLAHARMGRPARIERILNVACALGSATMNLLGADLGSPRSVAVYILPAVLYAACSDRLIATAAIAGGVPEVSVWRFLGTALLYGLRAVVALPSTAKGLRVRLLEATPLPSGAGATASKPPVLSGRPGATERRGRPVARESKKAVLLRLYAEHSDHGDRTKVSRVATELAPLAQLDPRTARTYLYAAVDGATP